MIKHLFTSGHTFGTQSNLYLPYSVTYIQFNLSTKNTCKHKAPIIFSYVDFRSHVLTLFLMVWIVFNVFVKLFAGLWVRKRRGNRVQSVTMKCSYSVERQVETQYHIESLTMHWNSLQTTGNIHSFISLSTPFQLVIPPAKKRCCFQGFVGIALSVILPVCPYNATPS